MSTMGEWISEAAAVVSLANTIPRLLRGSITRVAAWRSRQAAEHIGDIGRPYDARLCEAAGDHSRPGRRSAQCRTHHSGLIEPALTRPPVCRRPQPLSTGDTGGISTRRATLCCEEVIAWPN